MLKWKQASAAQEVTYFDEEDRVATQFKLESPLKPDGAQYFDQQNLAAADIAKGAPSHPYDDPNSLIGPFKDDLHISSTPVASSSVLDTFTASFVKRAPLNHSSTIFAGRDQYAAEFENGQTFSSDTSGTTLSSVVSGPAKETRLVSSKFNVYHWNDRRHMVITPHVDVELERTFPRLRVLRQKRRQRREEELTRAAYPEMRLVEAIDGYFVHQPKIHGQSPPRTLRGGRYKDAQPLCLLYRSHFWRKMKILVVDGVADDDFLDDRGVVPYKHHTPRKERGELDFAGYKVRKYHMWGESGKRYVRLLNEARRATRQQQLDDGERKPSRSRNRFIDADNSGKRAKADEAVYLEWTSPFSANTRKYHFTYAGIDFFWKGTGTVGDKRGCGMAARYNHLKLVARLSSEDGALPHQWLARADSDVKTTTPRRIFGIDVRGRTYHEICLAKYTSSALSMKAGTLELYDEKIYRFVQDFIVMRGMENVGTELGRDIESVKSTRLYTLFVATAICMLQSEWQKREAIRQLIQHAGAAA